MPHAPSGSGRAPLGFRRVLIVDDDVEIVAAVSGVLHEAGYQVLMAADGLTALERIRTDGVDAVVLDVMIPGIEGEKLCGFIRSDARLRHAAVVICSGLGRRELALLPEVSADAYVAKGSPQQTAADVLLVMRRLAEPSETNETGDLVLGYEGFGSRRPLTRLVARLRRYQEILSSLTDALIEVDQAGRVLWLNRAALEFIGCSERDALGRPLAEILGPEPDLEIERAVARFSNSKRPQGVFGHRIREADWEITLTGRFEGGRRLGTLLAFRRILDGNTQQEDAGADGFGLAVQPGDAAVGTAPGADR